MNEALTLGVIGHVDHGKTALVRALSGIETDRLKEEQERGLSIVLGFAFIETGHGVVDLIDAPGHENFIRAMIAGATALDGIVLCVAANEGVKPQTVEHFNIARLLGVERGCIVVTKTDLVDAAALAAIRAELEGFVRDSFLEAAPVFEVSAATGDGIDTLRQELIDMAAMPVAREDRGQFFLPLDRRFTIRGFGQVVTGTLRGGPLAVGDAVEIMPAGRPATVRALQNHNRSIERAIPGQRVAVNLRHVDRDEVRRGDVLASPGSLQPTKRLAAELQLLDDAAGAVKNGSVVRLLTGTTEAMATLRLLDRRELTPGETCVAQLSLDRAIATIPAEHFLLRSISPMQTIGGGRILEVNAKRHRRFDAVVTQRLETVASGDLRRIVQQRLDEAAGQGVNCLALAEDLGVSRQQLINEVSGLATIAITDDLIVTAQTVAALTAEVVTTITNFHQQQPLKNGIDVGTLAKELASKPGAEVLRYVVRQLVEQGKLRSDNEILSIASFDPFASLGAAGRKLAVAIERAFLDAGLESPSPQAVLGADKTKRAVYQLLLDTGRLVRLKTYDRNSQMVVHATALEQVQQAIQDKYPYPASFALKDIRDLLGSTRKYVVPLMEHLDATGSTMRHGDLRRLRE